VPHNPDETERAANERLASIGALYLDQVIDAIEGTAATQQTHERMLRLKLGVATIVVLDQLALQVRELSTRLWYERLPVAEPDEDDRAKEDRRRQGTLADHGLT
jgi:hypothetical protein